ncbi:hypothetical protein FRB99_001671 [Tulasnella sp. 403]|nr:hypothetical protein FRB99_001671 [Tulasnella sp. 403]
MSPPPTPPHHSASTPPPSSAVPNFRLPSQPTILLKAPSEETIARLKQLAPPLAINLAVGGGWSNDVLFDSALGVLPLCSSPPSTSQFNFHASSKDFPIDPRQQARIQAYQARQRQAQAARSRAGSTNPGPSSPDPTGRRPSWTPPSQSLSRPSSSHRLRPTLSSNALSARTSILGSSSSSGPAPPDNLASRRGSLTPGYDPFSKAGTSIVVQPATAQSPGLRRESAPVQGAQSISVSPSSPLSLQTVDASRRSSAPGGQSKNVTPMRTVRLHVEYLTAQSALIRQVLAEAAGYKPVTLVPPTPSSATVPLSPTSESPTPTQPAFTPTSVNPLATPPPETPPNPFPHSFFRFSPHRYPKVIHPKSPNSSDPSASPLPGPTIILPVPDPVSFPLLIHYMYHGKMDAIERTLKEGQVSWEGLVRNVEYLGLRDDVKKFLGRWWKNWRDSEARGEGRPTPTDEDDDEDRASPNERSYPYPSPRDVRMDVDGDGDVGEWTAAASGAAAGGGGGELVDEMAGLLGRF